MDKVFILVGDTEYGITTYAYSARDKAMLALQESLDNDRDIQYIVREHNLPHLTAEDYLERGLDEYGGCESAYWINELDIDAARGDGSPHY